MEQDQRIIYLDNFTLSEPTSRVKSAFEKARQEARWDITAAYQTNGVLFDAVEKSIGYLYELVGADPADRFFFGQSEAQLSSEVMFSLLLDEMYHTGKNHLIAPKTEKASILRTMERLQDIGCTMTLVDVDENGQVTVDAIEKHVTKRTALVALSWVDGLLGTIRPIWEIADFCKSKEIPCYVQASEIFAKLFFRFRDLPINYLSFSGELFNGPKGGAGLFVKKGRKHPGISYPLGARNASFEGGDLATLIAMGEAAGENLDMMDSMCMETAHLRARFEDLLESQISGVTFFGKGASRVPNTSCFAIEGIHADLLLFHMAHHNVFATLGGGQRQKLEHVLSVSGIDKALAKCAISVTLSFQTSEEEIKEAVSRICKIVEKLKKTCEAAL